MCTNNRKRFYDLSFFKTCTRSLKKQTQLLIVPYAYGLYCPILSTIYHGWGAGPDLQDPGFRRGFVCSAQLQNVFVARSFHYCLRPCSRRHGNSAVSISTFSVGSFSVLRPSKKMTIYQIQG